MALSCQAVHCVVRIRATTYVRTYVRNVRAHVPSWSKIWAQPLAFLKSECFAAYASGPQISFHHASASSSTTFPASRHKSVAIRRRRRNPSCQATLEYLEESFPFLEISPHAPQLQFHASSATPSAENIFETRRLDPAMPEPKCVRKRHARTVVGAKLWWVFVAR